MWEAWKSLTRTARKRGGYDARWDDFWVFLEDVGERPDPRARLYRIDEGRPYAKGNVEWKKPVIDISQLKDKALYQRAWRMKKPHLARRAGLRRHYGLSLEKYDEMHASQNGLCAICGQPETLIDKRTGRPFMLAVDHCHRTDKIRGVLCSNHNTALGLFQDDSLHLQAAIDYLKRHGA